MEYRFKVGVYTAVTLFICTILIGWYPHMDTIKVKKNVDKVYLTSDEALNHGLEYKSGKRYYIEYTTITEKKKSYIPFKYDVKVLEQTEKYFLEDITEKN